MSTQIPVIRYFACRGRVEPLRLLFTEVDISWKENPLIDVGGWAEEKKSTPFGSLPIVHHGDMELSQTMAILRHYSKQHQFLGSSPSESLRVDIMVEAVLDAQEKLAKKYYWNPTWKEDKSEVEVSLLPPAYENIENFLKKDSGGGPFVLGDALSLADLMLWCFLDLMQPFVPEALEKYARLQQFYNDFRQRPKISAYLHSEKRWKNHTIPLSPVGGTPETSSQP